MTVLAVLPTEAEALAMTPEQVLVVLDNTKVWLSTVATRPIEQVRDFKATATTYETWVRELDLGKDCQLAAAEVVRRAERGLGLAIRAGQERGEIARRSDNRFTVRGLETTSYSLKEVFSSTDERAHVYAMTDAVSDEQFEEAVAVAKSERNLSRANTVKNVKVITTADLPPAEMKTSRENAIREEKRKRYDTSDRPDILRGTRRFDSNRFVSQAVLSSYMDEELLLSVNYDELDRDSLMEWSISLAKSIKALGSLKRNIDREIDQ